MQNLELYGRNEMENKGKTFFRKCLFSALLKPKMFPITSYYFSK